MCDCHCLFGWALTSQGAAAEGKGFYSHVIDMPVRPAWDARTKRSKLLRTEERYFAEWLENIYTNFETKRLNHFEQNLGVRQVSTFLLSSRFLFSSPFFSSLHPLSLAHT